MTQDERLDRIEHITAGMFEQTRKDREEDRQLWRDTQRQIDDNARAITRLTGEISELRVIIRDLAQESHAADERLGQRILDLVSAIGSKL